VRAIEDATGRQLDWFFDQWVVKGAGHPELDVRYEWDGERNLAAFTVVQTHKVEGATPLFRIPIALRLVIGEERRLVEVELTEQQQTFYVTCEREPSQAIFDPGKALLARIKTEKPLPMWIAELAGAELGIDRVYAARELGTRGGIQPTQALIESLAGDPSWVVQFAAALALGALRTEVARDALIAAVATTEHPRARRAVVRALGQFRGDELAAATLARVVESGDPSYFVEAEACLSLGKTRSPRAAELLTRASERESYNDVIRQYAYRGLAEARAESAIPMLVAATEYGRVSHGRRAALAALADLTRGRRDRSEREARELLEERLRDRDYRIQFAALEALAVLGDPASIGALRDLVARELDGRLRRRGREILRDISEGRSPAAEIAALRDELDRLRGDSARMRERLDRMEAAAGATAGPEAPRPAPSKNGTSNKRRATTVRDTVRRTPPARRGPPARKRR
jgi:aminopeptidase N